MYFPSPLLYLDEMLLIYEVAHSDQKGEIQQWIRLFVNLFVSGSVIFFVLIKQKMMILRPVVAFFLLFCGKKL